MSETVDRIIKNVVAAFLAFVFFLLCAFGCVIQLALVLIVVPALSFTVYEFVATFMGALIL